MARLPLDARKVAESKKKRRVGARRSGSADMAMLAAAGLAINSANAAQKPLPDSEALTGLVGRVQDLELSALEAELLQAAGVGPETDSLDGESAIEVAGSAQEEENEKTTASTAESLQLASADSGAIHYPSAGAYTATDAPSWSQMLLAQAGEVGAGSSASSASAAAAAGAGVSGVVVGALAIAAAAAAGGGSGGGASGDGGRAIDGYLSGATVTRVNGSGNSVTTDANGNFTGLTGTGPIKIVGGIDTSTGQAFTGTLLAPAGSAVITPLTTLVQILVTSGEANSVSAATTLVLEKFGLSSSFNLLNADPVALVRAGGADASAALLVQKAAVSVATLLQAATGTPSAFEDLAEILAQQIADADGEVDLSAAGFIQELLTSAIGTGTVVLNDSYDSAGEIAAFVRLIDDAIDDIARATNLAGIADVQSDTLLAADPELFDVDENEIDVDDSDSESLNYVKANVDGALVFVDGVDNDLIGAFGSSSDVVSNDPAGEGTVYYLDAASLLDVVDSGVDTLVFDLDSDGVADVEDPIVVAVLDRQDLALGSEFGAYSDSTNYDLLTDNVYLNASALVGLREIGVDTLAFDLEGSIAANSYLELDTVELPYTNVDGIVLNPDSVHQITAVDRYLTYNVTAVVDDADLDYLGSGFDSDFTGSTVYLDAEKLQAIAYLGVDNLALDDDLGGPGTDIVATLRDPEGFEALDWLMGGSDENLEILFRTLSGFGVDSLAIDWDAVSSDGFFGSTTYDEFQSAWVDFGLDVSVVNLVGVSDQD